MRITKDAKGGWLWSLEVNGLFSTKYTYRERCGCKFNGQVKEKFKLLWELKISTKPRYSCVEAI